MSSASDIEIRLALLEHLLAEPRKADKIEEIMILHRAEAARAAGWKYMATGKGDLVALTNALETAGIALRGIISTRLGVDACDSFVMARLSSSSTRIDVRSLVEQAKVLHLLDRNVDLESRTRTLWRRHLKALDKATANSA